MTAESDDLPIRRILAAFDVTSAGPEALDAAVEMAARLRAELIALFVEDPGLLRLAGLPFVQQVTAYGAARRFEPEAMEAEMRALMARAERRLAEAAARHRLIWSVRSVRGPLAEALAVAGVEADLVMLETALRPFVPRLRLRADIRAAVERAGRPALLLAPGARLRAPIIALYEGPQSGKVVRAAAALARRLGVPLDLALRPQEGTAAAALVEQARAALPADVGGRLRLLGPAIDLCALMQQAERGLLVVAAESPLLDAAEAWERLCQNDCTLLVVR